MSKFDDVQVDEMVGVYMASVEAGDDYESRTEVVEGLASKLKVSVPAVRGKLVAEGVYVAKEVATKGKTEGVKKEDIVKAIEASFGLKLTSLGNMTKKDLEAFWARFVEMSAVREANEGK